MLLHLLLVDLSWEIWRDERFLHDQVGLDSTRHHPAVFSLDSSFPATPSICSTLPKAVSGQQWQQTTNKEVKRNCTCGFWAALYWKHTHTWWILPQVAWGLTAQCDIVPVVIPIACMTVLWLWTKSKAQHGGQYFGTTRHKMGIEGSCFGMRDGCHHHIELPKPQSDSPRGHVTGASSICALPVHHQYTINKIKEHGMDLW